MTPNGFAHFADALVFVHGHKALAEAARHAELCERSGDMETAARWRRAMAHVKAADTETKQKHCLAA
jgi:hypothetical protein